MIIHTKTSNRHRSQSPTQCSSSAPTQFQVHSWLLTKNKKIKIIVKNTHKIDSTTRNNLDEAILSFSEIDARLSQQSIRIRKGGLSLTTDNHKCASNTSIAIIIPYRDRLDNLKVFLNNMHPFLTRQRINYGVYLVEPKGNVTFNRGLLMNIGYVQALRDTNAALQSAKLNWTCFIFHDVDMLPEDVRNVYHCDESVPLHLAHTRDTRNYSTADYQKIYFGGVTALTGEQFARINGFSNLFFGWGMEDDNLRERVNHVYGRFVKVAPHIGRYHSESHDIQERNEARRKIFNDLESYRKRKGLTEGLATLNYTLLSVLRAPLYTHISVTYDQDFVLRSFYNRSDVRELIPSPLFNMNSG